ncbi:VOC family protein [Salinivibrio proteolyticus]|uniref:VOC family protein n=1 Tax=Salinivibrio proteolyticus TaxID=334715 RepID=UPI0009897232|nr:VOC family protein [Salinivibrio proteolyticus]OOF29413.1 glyoxalase [Salinivibrio proteolyticus]
MSIKTRANLQLVYVSNIDRSVSFYQQLFQCEPVFTSPRYVAFSASEQGDALFALWTGGEQPSPSITRLSEIGIMVPTNDDVDAVFDQWSNNLTINVIQPPYDDVFGRTFVIQDPDGHFVRVAPID